ncbi:MAG TPA: hypothetical protein VG013_28540 [Gemmataceae bacterium]|jgi:hypothetical protein|nr:hypothetical protein [Gemmataceae bacterium]
MKTVELLGQVDEQHRLCVEVPAGVQPGPMKIILHLPENESEAESWAIGVAQAWAADWSDPREDIYSLEDGVPVDEPR